VTWPHVISAAKPCAKRSALYVVTEWVEGKTLSQWMIDTPNPGLDKIRELAGQIITGLRALHRRDMLHQDLRPENLMIYTQGTVKIIDLGSTTVADVEEAAPGTLDLLPGTYQYTAPEYLSGDSVGWRSDPYTLGVIVYEMLTGGLPYGAQVARILTRRDQQGLRYDTAHGNDTGVPDWMDAALRRAVHPDAVRRYDALSVFLADLKRPSAGWIYKRHVPLAERNPVAFWQGVSAILTVLCLILAAQLSG
jgi:serine/threonine protein kinase